MVASLTRLLDPATALTASTNSGSAGQAFTSSRPVGGTLVLDALWRRLGIDTVMARLLEGRKRDPRTERVLFALVANRALAPGSRSPTSCRVQIALATTSGACWSSTAPFRSATNSQSATTNGRPVHSSG